MSNDGTDRPPPKGDAVPAGLTYDKAAPGEFFVVSPTGEVGSVPKSDLAQAQADGFRAASPQEVTAARNKVVYESVPGQIATAALGAGRGMFLGLPVADAAFVAGSRAAGGSDAEAKQTILDLQAANPGTYLASEVAGSLLMPGPKGGGLAKAIGHASAEGALTGIGSSISDAYLNNQALTAEKLAAAALQGGAIGGGAALGFNLGARGVGAMFRKGGSMVARLAEAPGAAAYQRAGDDLFSKAAPGLGRALDLIDAAASTVSGAPRGAFRDMFTRGRGGRFGFEAATQADDILARSGDEMFERLKRLHSAQEAAARRFKGDLKGDQISQIISRGDDAFARQVDASKGAIDLMRKEVTEMLGREADFGGRGFLGKTSKRLDAIESKIDEAIKAGDPDAGAKAYMWLDGFKRDIGKRATKMTRRAQRGGTVDDLATAKWFDNSYEKLRAVLEDGGTWGQAAEAQRAINKQWARSIEGSRDFSKLFLTTKQGRFGADVRHVDRDKVGGFLKSLTNPDKAANLDALNRHVDEMIDFAETAERHMALPAGERAKIRRMADEASALKKALGDSRDAITKANQLKALEGTGDGIGLGIGGGLLGGLPGAVVGGIAGTLANPAKLVKRVAAVHRIVGDVDLRKAKALGELVAGAVPRVDGTVAGRVARATWEPEYERRSKETRLAAREPERVREDALRALAPVAPAGDRAAEAAADTYLRRQQFLGNLLPQHDVTAILARPRKANASEAHAYLQAARILDDPTKLMKAAASGSVSAAEVRAVGEVYPGMLQEMRRDVAVELLKLDEQGKALPYGRRVALSIMLDAPVDPLMRPQTVALLQSTYAEAAAAQPPAMQRPGGKAPDIASAYRAGSEEDEDY